MNRAQRLSRWAVGLFLGLVVVIAWSQAAEARPESPEHPGAPAQPEEGEDVARTCHWEIREGRNGARDTGVLICDPPVNDFREVPEEERPELPSNCKYMRPGSGVAATDGPEENVFCAEAGKMIVYCRDQEERLGMNWAENDTEKQVELPQNAPQWWLDEIRIETENAGKGDGGMGCKLAEHPPATPCSERNTTDPEAADYYQSDDGLVPDRCWGTYPSKHYSFTSTPGGPFAFDDKMQGWLGSLMFSFGKGAVVSVLWMVGWAFTFDISDYTTFSANISESYKVAIVAGFDLEDMVWFCLVAWAGFAALRGKLGMAVSEIAISVIMSALMTVFYAGRVGYMDDLAGLLDETSARLLVAGRHLTCVPDDYKLQPGDVNLGQSDCREHEIKVRADTSRPAVINDEIRPLQEHIHRAFVEEPYAYLAWGRVTTDECLEAQNQIVATGFNEEGWPERRMRRAGCDQLANFNRDPTSERMLGALLTMGAGGTVALFLGFMSLTVVISKFLLALHFAALPFIALGAIAPGSARRICWTALGTTLQLSFGVVGMSFLLSLELLGTDEVLRATEEIELVQRWFIVLLVVGSVYFGRKRLLASTKNLGETLADNLTRMSPAGHQWQGSNKGVDLTGIDRGVKKGAVGVGIAAAAAGRWYSQRAGERRQARRTERNAHRRRRVDAMRGEYRIDAYRFHPNSGTPEPINTQKQTPSPPAAKPVPIGRERIQAVYNDYASRNPIAHPVSYVTDKLHKKLPVIGTEARMRKRSEKLFERGIVNPRPRTKSGLHWR